MASADRTSIRLVVNPSAGRGRGARWLAKLPAQAGLRPLLADGPDDVREHARLAVGEGAERMIVAGGDGTLHQAIPALAGSGCALGIVPLGSGNDLARALALPGDPSRALRRALDGPIRRIDLGETGGHLWAGVAALGFDAEVARRVRDRRETAGGKSVYLKAILATLRGFVPPHLVTHDDHGSYSGRVMLAALANSPFYGGGFRIAPEASLDDGYLDLVIVPEMSRWRFLALITSVVLGRTPRGNLVRRRVRQFHLTADRDCAVLADGEPVGLAGPIQAAHSIIHPGALAIAG